MKTPILLGLIMLIVSCSSHDTQSETTKHEASTDQILFKADTTSLTNSSVDQEFQLPPLSSNIPNNITEITNDITKYYKRDEAADNQIEVLTSRDEKGTMLKTRIRDNSDTDGNNVISYNHIPFAKNFIIGDLNEDNTPDYVIPVYSNGGGSHEWVEIFIYTSNGNSLMGNGPFHSDDIAICTIQNSHGGRFWPNEIKNGVIYGFTNCYKDGDAHCCPSIELKSSYKLVDGKLVIQKK
jgi:hypothetical protein